MTRNRLVRPALTIAAALLAASCGTAATGDSGRTNAAAEPATTTLRTQEVATLAQPWAATFIPGTSLLFVTEKAGTARIIDTSSDAPRLVTISGLPAVDAGGQGGLGDALFLPSEAAPKLDRRTIYLSWVEAGAGDTRGAVVGRGTLRCWVANECAVEDLQVIWRQTPKTSGRGHYSQRLALSPDGQFLFIASGDRQKMAPAQDMAGNLGKIVRLTLDGRPAPGNPFAGQPAPADQVWSLGHRNILGLAFDEGGRLWGLEHGPAGGDELNLIRAGANYGWPVVSEGEHYGGAKIPPHSSRPDLAAPALSWTPVIAPGGMIFYRGSLFPGWRGQALIAGLATEALIGVGFDGERPRELARHPLDQRIRAVAEGPDGAVYLLEDGARGRLLRLTPAP